MLHDQRQAWDMKPDGSYVQRTPSASDSTAGPEVQGTHVTLMNLALRRIDLEPSKARPATQPA